MNQQIYTLLFPIKKWIFLLVIFTVGQSFAQQIITDRPDQTESSSTVGNGDLQIESGFLVEYEGDDIVSNQTILLPTSLFRFGITKNIELRLLNQFESSRSNSQTNNGISDVEIGTKIQLFKAKESSFELAILSHIIVPIGTKKLTNGKFGTINKISFSHDLGERTSLGYNFGYDYFGAGNGDLTYSLAFGIGVNDNVSIYIEPYGAYAEFKTYVQNFDTGLTYLVTDNFQFDFSFGMGLNHRMNYISAGFSWLLRRK